MHMPSRYLHLFTLLFPVVLLTSCLGDPPLVEDSPIQAAYLGMRKGKPPLLIHSVRITLENQHDQPVWFVLPDRGNEPLPEYGAFPIAHWTEHPFQGKLFKGDGGSAIEVSMYGSNGFRAYRLPAKGRLELDDYNLDADKALGQLWVLEALALKVNGTTPLEEWLPYQTTSGDQVRVTIEGFSDWTNLDWDSKKHARRNDYPADKVEEVEAEGFTCWRIRLISGK
jgi:hypothetical protein